MTIQTILSSKDGNVVTTDADALVVDVARMFRKIGIGFVAIVESGKAIGTVSERDIIQALVKNDGDVSVIKVRDIITTNIITCGLDISTSELSDLMTSNRTRHVLVMDEGNLMGVVSIGDLVKHSLNECRVDSGAMREYISGQGYQ